MDCCADCQASSSHTDRSAQHLAKLLTPVCRVTHDTSEVPGRDALQTSAALPLERNRPWPTRGISAAPCSTAELPKSSCLRRCSSGFSTFCNVWNACCYTGIFMKWLKISAWKRLERPQCYGYYYNCQNVFSQKKFQTHMPRSPSIGVESQLPALQLAWVFSLFSLCPLQCLK